MTTVGRAKMPSSSIFHRVSFSTTIIHTTMMLTQILAVVRHWQTDVLSDEIIVDVVSGIQKSVAKVLPQQWEAEVILDERMVLSHREFFVKWKGYPLSQCSWETEPAMLEHYPEAAAAWEKEQRERFLNPMHRGRPRVTPGSPEDMMRHGRSPTRPHVSGIRRRRSNNSPTKGAVGHVRSSPHASPPPSRGAMRSSGGSPDKHRTTSTIGSPLKTMATPTKSTPLRTRSAVGSGKKLSPLDHSPEVVRVGPETSFSVPRRGILRSSEGARVVPGRVKPGYKGQGSGLDKNAPIPMGHGVSGDPPSVLGTTKGPSPYAQPLITLSNKKRTSSPRSPPRTAGAPTVTKTTGAAKHSVSPIVNKNNNAMGSVETPPVAAALDIFLPMSEAVPDDESVVAVATHEGEKEGHEGQTEGHEGDSVADNDVGQNQTTDARSNGHNDEGSSIQKIDEASAHSILSNEEPLIVKAVRTEEQITPTMPTVEPSPTEQQDRVGDAPPKVIDVVSSHLPLEDEEENVSSAIPMQTTESTMPARTRSVTPEAAAVSTFEVGAMVGTVVSQTASKVLSNVIDIDVVRPISPFQRPWTAAPPTLTAEDVVLPGPEARQLVGSGRFAEVFVGVMPRADDHGKDLEVAVKVFDKTFTADQVSDTGGSGSGHQNEDNENNPLIVYAHAFQREMQLLHLAQRRRGIPGIVKFFGYSFERTEGTDGSCRINGRIVTELLRGGNLAMNLKDLSGRGLSKPPISHVVAIGLALSDALDALHSQTPAVVHGDIKLANALSSRRLWDTPEHVGAIGLGDATIKLCDFGVAAANVPRVSDASGGLEGGGGTWTHMAPEVLLGEKGTAASDVYSLGILLWETCMCQEAFAECVGPMDVVRAVLEKKRPGGAGRPGWRLGLSDDFVGIIESCWKHDAKERPTMAQVATSLRRLYEQMETISTTETNGRSQTQDDPQSQPQESST